MSWPDEKARLDAEASNDAARWPFAYGLDRPDATWCRCAGFFKQQRRHALTTCTILCPCASGDDVNDPQDLTCQRALHAARCARHRAPPASDRDACLCCRTAERGSCAHRPVRVFVLQRAFAVFWAASLRYVSGLEGATGPKRSRGACDRCAQRRPRLQVHETVKHVESSASFFQN